MPNTIKMSNVVQKSVEIIEAHYKTSFDETSLDFSGLVAMLRNTAMRFVYPGREKQAAEDTVLYRLLQKRYAYPFACAEKVAAFIEREYGWRLSENDVSFLTLYIDRISPATPLDAASLGAEGASLGGGAV
jgi:beta-glucoside operon transcriptional antiterminator